MIEVTFPRGSNPLKLIEYTLNILAQMETVPDGEEIILDLSKTKFVFPCAILLLASKIKEMESKGARISYISPEDEQVQEYLEKIGFPLGSTIDGGSFYPINHFENKPEDTSQINREANALIGKMSGKIPKNFGQTIPYIIGELADNIDQHSNFSFASIMSQYFPHKNYVDIGFLDNGITIPRLFESKDIKFSNDSEAIKMALWGEVTTKEGETRGFGLKSCRRLAEELNGTIHIVSRKGILILESGKEPILKDFENNSFKGTILNFRLKAPASKLNIYPVIEPRNS